MRSKPGRPASSWRSARALGLVAALAGGWACGTVAPDPPQAPSPALEDAYRANNRGVALLEQLRHEDAAAAFRDAIRTAPSLGLAHVNLALALFYAQDSSGARQSAEEAARLMPEAPQPPYLLGLIARAESRTEAARELFDRVRAIDPTDAGASINAAQIRLEAGEHREAAALLRPVADAEPFNVTAAYVLGLALTRSGEAEAGRAMLERAQRLRGSGYGVTLGTGYLEQGRHAEAIASTGAEPDLVDRSDPGVKWVPGTLGVAASEHAPDPSTLRRFTVADLGPEGVNALAAALGGAIVPLDFDGDTDLDLLVASAEGQYLLRNDGGRTWTDATTSAGLDAPPARAVPLAGVAADYDNDGAVDIFVARWGRSSLYHNDGSGRFTDATRTARLPDLPFLPGAAAFTDIDHDGDVDLVVGGLVDMAATLKQRRPDGWRFPADFAPAPVTLLRNNRDGTFSDITAASGLALKGHTTAIIPTDFDNRRDVDLLILDRIAPPRLLANQRDGSFRDVSRETGLMGVGQTGQGITAVAAGDVNHDDWPDFFFAREDGGVFATSDGRGRFAISAALPATRRAVAAQLADVDNDGLLDLVSWTHDGPQIFRNVGREWQALTAAVAPLAGHPSGAGPSSARAVALADFDADGDTDAVTHGGAGLVAWRSEAPAASGSLRVSLQGRASNGLGVGAKVQVRAGRLMARRELAAASPPAGPADIVFGLGRRPAADAVRVLWPSGIVQAETGAVPAALATQIRIEELDRKPSSCPLLFTWNGQRFEFVTDFLGAGEMGYWEAPGARNHADPIEYVRIRSDQLQPREGKLELRLTNELEETVYIDRAQLLVVDHVEAMAVYPNEGMTEPAKPFALHAVTGIGPAKKVTDDRGRDVSADVARADWKAPVGFSLLPIRGYAANHTLTIDLRQTTDRGDVRTHEAHQAAPSGVANVLLLTGWTDYAFSSDNVAAHQAGISLEPPTLEIRTVSGGWRPSGVAVGVPVGRPQTIAVDLSGALRAGEHEVRLATNMRVYWDVVQLGVRMRNRQPTLHSLEAVAATLSERGFSAETRPTPQAPVLYDYHRVSPEAGWKALPGAYTRQGDVLDLLTSADDRLVITKSGDEIALTFDARALPPLPTGWTRTYLLRAEGFSKEMDINSASPDRVEPLPFRAMPSYPYHPVTLYPDSPALRHYRDTYNTRRVLRSIPRL